MIQSTRSQSVKWFCVAGRFQCATRASEEPQTPEFTWHTVLNVPSKLPFETGAQESTEFMPTQSDSEFIPHLPRGRNNKDRMKCQICYRKQHKWNLRCESPMGCSKTLMLCNDCYPHHTKRPTIHFCCGTCATEYALTYPNNPYTLWYVKD